MEMMSIRRDNYREEGEAISKQKHHKALAVVAASKGEGVSSFYDRDIDCLFILQDFVGIEPDAPVGTRRTERKAKGKLKRRKNQNREDDRSKENSRPLYRSFKGAVGREADGSFTGFEPEVRFGGCSGVVSGSGNNDGVMTDRYKGLRSQLYKGKHTNVGRDSINVLDSTAGRPVPESVGGDSVDRRFVLGDVSQAGMYDRDVEGAECSPAPVTRTDRCSLGRPAANNEALITRYTTTFTLDTAGVCPGHCKLRLSKTNDLDMYDLEQPLSCELTDMYSQIIYSSLYKSKDGNIYLSSHSFMQGSRSYMEMVDRIERNPEIAGPSIPLKIAGVSFDRVHALKCHCPRLLAAWANRARPYSWPNKQLVEEIALTDGQLVATGVKSSPSKWTEWRICFVPSELKLSHSWTETQIKCYIVLKMITTDILNCVCDGVSSYMMKNIMFWMAEQLPENIFKTDNLLYLIMLGLRILLRAVTDENFLPYYMIPDRNLLLGKVWPQSVRQLSRLLKRLLREGPRFLTAIDKINIAMTSLNMAELNLYRKQRDEVETLLLSVKNILLPLQESTDPESEEELTALGEEETDICNAFIDRLSDIVMTDLELLQERGMSEEYVCDLFMQRLKIILS